MSFLSELNKQGVGVIERDNPFKIILTFTNQRNEPYEIVIKYSVSRPQMWLGVVFVLREQQWKREELVYKECKDDSLEELVIKYINMVIKNAV